MRAARRPFAVCLLRAHAAVALSRRTSGGRAGGRVCGPLEDLAEELRDLGQVAHQPVHLSATAGRGAWFRFSGPIRTTVLSPPSPRFPTALCFVFSLVRMGSAAHSHQPRRRPSARFLATCRGSGSRHTRSARRRECVGGARLVHDVAVERAVGAGGLQRFDGVLDGACSPREKEHRLNTHTSDGHPGTFGADVDAYTLTRVVSCLCRTGIATSEPFRGGRERRRQAGRGGRRGAAAGGM